MCYSDADTDDDTDDDSHAEDACNNIFTIFFCTVHSPFRFQKVVDIVTQSPYTI